MPDKHTLMLTLLWVLGTVQARAADIEEGRIGLVVSHIEYALASATDASAACPNGMALNLQEIYALTPKGQRRADETDENYMQRLRAAAKVLGTSADGQNLCEHPEAGQVDPNYRTVQGVSSEVYGIDLDGVDSENDFPGVDGAKGIDNQWYRVVGCSRSFQPGGMSNSFYIVMLTGSWGILVTLEGVDSLVDDADVDVNVYANTDPIRLSPERIPLSYVSYTATQDPHFSAHTTGFIRDGQLFTSSFDVVLRYELNSMLLERPLRDAQLVLTMNDDGTAKGYLAGYTPIDAAYDMQFGYRNGRTVGGELSPASLRSQSANGAAFVLGDTCHGAYQALWASADGHPDPVTGRNTSISTQYRLELLPAFVIEGAGAAELSEAEVK